MLVAGGVDDAVEAELGAEDGLPQEVEPRDPVARGRDDDGHADVADEVGGADREDHPGEAVVSGRDLLAHVLSAVEIK